MNSFIQISDCHIDDNEYVMGVNTQQQLKKVVKKINTVNTDALLISGDLSHSGTIKSYQTLQQILASIKTNTFIIAGNHDDKNNLNAVFSDCLFNRFSLGEWEIISIDSVQANKTSGYLTAHELNKLNILLEQSSAKYQLLVLHHPIVGMMSSWDDALSLENPEELFLLIDKYPKIQTVVFGHAHQAGEFKKGNLKIISCPSTAGQFNHETRIGFNHYTLHKNGQLDCYTQWLK